jgi:hypothetical protein
MRKLKSTVWGTALTAFERRGREKGRGKRLYSYAVAIPVLLLAGVASAQYGQHPMLDAAANRVIQKYQNSSCQQLWQDRFAPKSQREQEAVNFLRSDPQMRALFIDKVAAPIANKLFECGMIP